MAGFELHILVTPESIFGMGAHHKVGNYAQNTPANGHALSAIQGVKENLPTPRR
jgi:hypothetical protein